MTELSHPQPQAMGIGLRHAASLTATIAVVVDRFLPSASSAPRRQRGDAQDSPLVDPNRAA